jgi:signal transduction histidine kinase
MVAVRVVDRGPGVPTEGRERLFARFGRLEGSAIRAGHVGTGLGLYLSRELARAMGGELDLEATGQQGSTFRLRLPAVAGVSAPLAGEPPPG